AAHSVTPSLQAGVFAIFLQAAVVAALALLISTFATSTLFTTITGTLVYFIGNFQAEAREYWLSASGAGESMAGRIGSLAITLIFPDFQLFNVVDAAIEGQVITFTAIASLTGVALFYAGIYSVLSWFVFADKEF